MVVSNIIPIFAAVRKSIVSPLKIISYGLQKRTSISYCRLIQKERAEEWFKAAFRTQPKTQDAEGNDLRQKLNEITLKKTKTEGTGKNKTIVPVEIDNEDDVKEFLNDLITKHDKRLAANAKKKEAKEADEAKLPRL